MGQFNLPNSSNLQQHSQPYPVGMGSAEAIAASSGEHQQVEEELFSDAEPQHVDTEELFGKYVTHIGCFQACHMCTQSETRFVGKSQIRNNGNVSFFCHLL